MKLLGPCGQSVIVGVDYLGSLYDNLCYKLCVGAYEAGNGHEIRVHKVNR